MLGVITILMSCNQQAENKNILINEIEAHKNAEITVYTDLSATLSKSQTFLWEDNKFYKTRNRFDMQISNDTVKNINDSLLLSYINFLNERGITINKNMDYSANYSLDEGMYNTININHDSIKLTCSIHSPAIQEIEVWQGNCKYYISVLDENLNGNYVLDTTQIESYSLKINH